MGWKSYKKESRDVEYGTQAEVFSTDQLQTGAILRIADSLETIAKDKSSLEAEIHKLKKDYAYMKENRDYYSAKLFSTEKSRNAYKGLYEKLKRAIGK